LKAVKVSKREGLKPVSIPGGRISGKKAVQDKEEAKSLGVLGCFCKLLT
jgi:hypothetical protein